MAFQLDAVLVAIEYKCFKQETIRDCYFYSRIMVACQSSARQNLWGFLSPAKSLLLELQTSQGMEQGLCTGRLF